MVDMTNDVTRFEEMFPDRFTEKDVIFMELKSESIPYPVVIYPWKIMKKQWNKKRDYSSRIHRDKSEAERGHHRYDDNRQKSEGENSRKRYRERSRDGENSRDRYRNRSRERYFKK